MAKRISDEKVDPPEPEITEELSDDELWRRALQDVRPIARRRRPLRPPRRGVPTGEMIRPGDIFRESVETLREIETWDRPDYVEGGSGQWNRRLLKKLRRGEFSVQESLDLHGFTQKEARRELDLFLRESAKLGYSCVRIVHGKGRNSPGRESVLKQKVPTWLMHRRNRPYVAAFTSARLGDGGSGALYVLLKDGLRRLKRGRRPGGKGNPRKKPE